MKALPVLLLLALAGCSFGRTMRASDAAEANPPAEQAPRERHPGAVALEAEAQALSDEGEHARAAAALERALRMSPDDAHLWLSLAGVRFAEGSWAQAETLAARAAQLAGSDEPLRREAVALEKRARARR